MDPSLATRREIDNADGRTVARRALPLKKPERDGALRPGSQRVKALYSCSISSGEAWASRMRTRYWKLTDFPGASRRSSESFPLLKIRAPSGFAAKRP